MAPRPVLRAHLSLALAAIILLACSATGMLAGTFAHTLANKHAALTSSGTPVISGTPPGESATATSAPQPTDTTVAIPPATGFTLGLSISNRTPSVGQSFTVTVTASANGAPLAGLSCSLRAPTGGPVGLLSSWPAPAVTDASGHANWTLTVPSVKPGTYGIEVEAVGAHNYEFHRYATLQVG